MKNGIAFLFFLFSITAFSQHDKIGTDFIHTLLVEKNYEKAYSDFDENIKTKVSVPLLEQTVLQLELQLGKFKKIIEINREKDTYYYYSEFEKMKLDIEISFNASAKIEGFFFKPHKNFTPEIRLGKDFNVMSNGIELKGTLLVPEKNNLKKLVLFVHGSGPNDRDETIFENKPFKDIAEKLYEKGIASYRFDKRSHSNPESFTDKSTIDDEVTKDVVNILAHFKSNPEFKDYEVTVIGHSLGAYLMPRIANQSNSVSKMVLMAGNARKLDQLILEQYDYLYSLNPSEEFKKEVAVMKEKITFLNSAAFTLETPKEKLPLDVPAYYWKSILEYQPLTEIQKVKKPILILQGERDYQVTMTDFNLWKQTLQKNKKAKFISYATLNHLFMEGTGKSSPIEYAIKANVAPTVIDDIFNFIIKN
nr:alpha/beta fold hydrolase [uncultured Flavobacterium sp.]